MKRIVTLVQYDVKHKDGPNYGKDAHGTFNQQTVDFVENRFCVYRNFIPKEVIDIHMDVWKTIEASQEMTDVVFNKESEPIPNSPNSSKYTSKGGHTTPMGVSMHRWIHRQLAGKFDLRLESTYSYTRKYDRGAYLKAHCDRPSCEVSATICTGYESDDGEPWTIWVDNTRNWVDEGTGDQENIFSATQGVPIRKRKGIPIKLEVGDLLLYQGPNVIHWRDHFLGNFSYHMFLHFHAISSSKLNQLANKDTEFYWHTREMNNTTASQHITALTYDGRGSPFRQKGDPADIEHEEKFSEWMKLYEKCPNKSSFVNNYDDLEIKKK